MKLTTSSKYTIHLKTCGLLRGLVMLAFVHQFSLSADEPGTVTILAAGDTTGFGITLTGIEAQDPMAGVRDRLGGAELFIFNHEGALIDPEAAGAACAPFGHQSVFHSPPGFVHVLKLGRHNVAALANNHIFDCGPEGLQGTIDALRDRGFAAVGAGTGSAQACAPEFFDQSGHRIAIFAFLAHSAERFGMREGSPGAATWEGCGGPDRLGQAAISADLVIVSLHLHLSQSWTEFAAPEHVDLAREVLAAGADIVLGHGPHVPQGVLQTEDGVALLSLGNFIFSPGYDMPDGASRSLVARIRVDADTIAVDLLPFRLADSGWPSPAQPDDARRISFDLMRLSAELGTQLGATSQGARVVYSRRPKPGAGSP